MRDTTILRAIQAWTVRQPDAPALICHDTSLTWRELTVAMDRAAAQLVSSGVLPGDRVGVLGGLSVEWAIAALGAIRAGGILCPLNERHKSVELGEVYRKLTPRVVVAAAANLEIAEAACTGITEPPQILDPRTLRTTDLDVPLPPPGRDPADAVCIIPTSGSTGLPKGVVYTHESLLGAFFEWSLQAPAHMGARTLNLSSMSFAAGLLNGFLAPLVLGGSIVMLPKWDPQVAMSLIASERVATMAGTTIFFEQMATLPSFESTDISSLKVVFIGGNPVTLQLIEAWSRKGVGLRQAYGLTESLSMVTFPTVELSMRKPESVGFGGILTTVEIMDLDGTPCPAGTPGEIWISGPGVARGYWQDDALTEQTFAGGWLRTGDVGVRDEEGAIRVVGRTKDVIISGGMNIYAAELERAVLELPAVLEAAVIGVSDDEFGETPAVLLRTSAEVPSHDIIDHCRNRLSNYKVPRYVVFRDNPLPRTSSMKIDKRILRAEYVDLPEHHDRIGRTAS
ncbi:MULTISPECIES: class I adenylate-forming enzyme family protein [unclassified Rhodococcus (in: high G+C Gram-positive bacteria)]|uniref:class I adenylate-forming enzyme family protein n=1 Tax=unclassified Rhodococcus (in: high G+C Gram-positive bacteria) TaxID=192944 RepID=UPI00163B1AAF|nr:MULTISPECIES: class I adenylate-forming enzyme family protein [unclassified Rhodococcus (in: high G+C Gram-positive bacteria)]MBC2640395.1 acyl--CoA ligase [Rhodococcus sp. 3A]MBC2894859.1 acyl--CoA ligase [Rhodococcus sp. 4CII]